MCRSYYHLNSRIMDILRTSTLKLSCKERQALCCTHKTRRFFSPVKSVFVIRVILFFSRSLQRKKKQHSDTVSNLQNFVSRKYLHHWTIHQLLKLCKLMFLVNAHKSKSSILMYFASFSEYVAVIQEVSFIFVSTTSPHSMFLSPSRL